MGVALFGWRGSSGRAAAPRRGAARGRRGPGSCVALLARLAACLTLPTAVAAAETELVIECPCSVESDGTTITATFGVANFGDEDAGPLTFTLGANFVYRVGFGGAALASQHYTLGQATIADALPAESTLAPASYPMSSVGNLRGWLRFLYGGLSSEQITLDFTLRLNDGGGSAFLRIGELPLNLTAAFSVHHPDYLQDTDGDGVGDVNERAEGTEPEDSASTPGDSTIDVLAYHTRGALDETGDIRPLRRAFAGANAIFRKSKVGLRFRLVGTVPVRLADEAPHVQDSAPVGGWRALAGEQGRYGADLSVLFWPGTHPSSGRLLNAGTRGRYFSGHLQHLGSIPSVTMRVGREEISDSGRVLAHQLGHVLGLGHDYWDPLNQGTWRWSRGHNPPGDFTTIMASPHPRSTRRAASVDVFSSPALVCRGRGNRDQPCGVDREQRLGADARASLDATRFQIAGIREGYPDADGDGNVDPMDAFPRDPSDWRDTDGDGIGDRTDTDDDGDGVADAADPLPLDGSEVADFDGDLIGDNADPDDDNDGALDGEDLLPRLKLHRSREWHVPLFPTGFKSPRQGLVRIFGGDMHIGVADGAGRYMGGLMLPVAGNAVRHLSSADLRNGRPELGLGAIGVGRGDWRLVLGSPDPYDQQVLAYVLTADGFMAPMHDVAPMTPLGELRIPTFHPGGERRRVSKLHLVNPGGYDAAVQVRGVDDEGQSPGTLVQLSVPAGGSRTLTATELEAGGDGLEGALGNGEGMWRLSVRSNHEVMAMSLLENAAGHLTNLSTVPEAVAPGLPYALPLFPAVGHPSGRRGVLRIINRTSEPAAVLIAAFDELGEEAGPLTLTLAGNAAVNLSSMDLEGGNEEKGLPEGTGAGFGDWSLLVQGETDIDVLAYVATADGLLTPMHDVAPQPTGNPAYLVWTFAPGSDSGWVGKLRVSNAGEDDTIIVRGYDDQGNESADDVGFFLPKGATRTFTAAELEVGGAGLQGALGDGAGMWRLHVAPSSNGRLLVTSLIESPFGHLVNLSSAPGRQSIGLEPGEIPQMVVIPAGRFRMGCLAADEDCDVFGSEEPVREVSIEAAFEVSRHEITYAQWDACVALGGCDGHEPSDFGQGRGNRPVTDVNWGQAKAYVASLSLATGKEYRLLTEAEWEYAARAGAATKFSWGDEVGHDRANCAQDICADAYRFTAPVGSFPPNAWGLFDMHGNVGEWVEDCWNDSYEGAPATAEAWQDGLCVLRVLRGGSYGSGVYGGDGIRAAARQGVTGGAAWDQIRSRVGFRVARTLVVPSPSGVVPSPEVAAGDSLRIDLASLFTIPGDEPLTFWAESSDPELATVSVRGGVLAVVSSTDGKEGSVTITVTAAGSDGMATITFEVKVAVLVEGPRSWRRLLLTQGADD